MSTPVSEVKGTSRCLCKSQGFCGHGQVGDASQGGLEQRFKSCGFLAAKTLLCRGLNSSAPQAPVWGKLPVTPAPGHQLPLSSVSTCSHMHILTNRHTEEHINKEKENLTRHIEGTQLLDIS